MADMSKLGKEFPSQTENRRQWILDTVRANQSCVRAILALLEVDEPRPARLILMDMKPMDRDAILQSDGILTSKQIEMLK